MYYAAMFAYYNSTTCSALRIATDNINTICEICYGVMVSNCSYSLDFY